MTATKHPPRYTALLAAAKFVEAESENALQNVTFHVDQMLAHLRAAAHYNTTHGLGLELPSELPLIDLIGQCNKAVNR